MRFTKMQGAGNDYLYIDARSIDADWPSLAREMSDRHFGVGGDGIILILPSRVAQLRMRIFNADGSEGEMCGNGIRCVAKYAVERGIVQLNGSGLLVETDAGVKTVEPRLEGDRVVGARVAMGKPELDPELVPVVLNNPSAERIREAVVNYPVTIGETCLKLSFVSTGNPHAVAFIDQPVDRFPLRDIGPQIEHHPMFPKRVNFEIANVLDRSHIKARVWERGSGLTLACGSGASAIGVASHLLGLTDEVVDITLPGGNLRVTWDGQGDVYLEGDAVEVFEGEWGG